jgi:hypothetical protein
VYDVILAESWGAYPAQQGAQNADAAGFELSGGNDVSLRALSIPEPNALSMLAGSIGLALGLQRFRRSRKYSAMP